MLIVAAGCLAGVSAAADAPKLEKLDLFERNTGGYALYRIPGIVVTAKGTLLVYCEARLHSGSDWDTIDIMLRRSTDTGRTWEPARKIADVPGPKAKNPVTQRLKSVRSDDVTYNNPLAIADRDGTVHFLFCLEYGRAFIMRSEDDGITFSKPMEITAAFEGFRPQYDWKVLATGPGHGIQLSSGRLLVPVWISLGTGGGAHRPSVASVIYSDDHGRSWQPGEIAVPDTPQFVFPSETAAVELAEGRVMLNSRTESPANRRVITYGRDGATGWTEPVFHEQLLEPICMASMVRLSQAPPSDRNRILFSNPNNLDRADGNAAPGKSRDRKNLAIKLSYDEGQNWPVQKVLEPGYSTYSDLAVGSDGTIYCFYERGSGTEAGARPTSYAYLTLARFNLEWLTDGNDSLHRQGPQGRF
jgi:sialidase-1